MSSTISITLPDTGDLDFYRQLGHIVFKLEDLGNDDLLRRSLLSQIKEKEEPKEKIKYTTLEELNLKSEL